MMMSQDMSTVPHVFCAFGAGLFRRALGALARLQPWGRRPSELGKESIIFVDADEVLLPPTNDHRAVLMQYDSSRIFSVAAATCGRLLVRCLVEVPVCVGESSRLGLFPGEVCFDPSHCNDLVELG